MIIDDRPFNGVYNGEDIEKELIQYMNQLREYMGEDLYPKEDEQYEKVEVPDGYNVSLTGKEFDKLPRDRQARIRDFWKSHADKMDRGHNNMCGLMYGYYNFAKLRGGKGELVYRRHDNWLFHLIESCLYGDNRLFKDHRGKGVIQVGRRRCGKSSKFGWMALQTISRNKDIDIMITSKTEDDAQRVVLGEKVFYMYNSLPLGIKPTLYKTSRSTLHLAKRETDEAGNMMIAGKNSKIVAKTPKPEALEGGTLKAWLHDEAPKTPHLQDLVDNTIEALNDAEGFNREGFAWLTGVSGDFGKFGEDFKDIWKNADSYNFIRVFTPGWVSLCVDDYGNEDVEAAVREILERRAKIFHNPNLTEQQRDKDLRALQQKFPLTIQESFMASGASKFDTYKIGQQMADLEMDPVHLMTGRIKVLDKTTARFEPQTNGNLFVLEPPQAGAKYVSGLDAYGLKQQEVTLGSRGVQWIFKLENRRLSPLDKERLLAKLREAETAKERLPIHLELGHLPVALHISDSKNPRTFGRNAVGVCNWYTQISKNGYPVKILTETSPSNIIEFLKDNHLQMTMNAPIMPGTVHTKQYLYERFGVDMKNYWADQRFGLLRHYTDQYCRRIYFTILLEKLLSYDETVPKKKHDEVDGFGVTLIHESDPRVEAWNNEPVEEENVKDSGWGKSIVNFKRKTA